jgi:hypothetical protein
MHTQIHSFVYISSYLPHTFTISGTGADIWSKSNFGPTGHHHPRSSPLPHVCTVLRASAIFKCILEVFCEGVQHRMRFCLDYLSCVKMAAFQLYLQSADRKTSGGWGATVMLFSGQNFSREKGSVRWRVVVRQQPILLSPKFRA